MKTLRVVVWKPSKYDADGFVERFHRGYMPNSTLQYLASMTPREVAGVRCEVIAIDEYVQTDLDALALLDPEPGVRTLLALVGVQSHQLHRALDLAAYARRRGALAIIGGPHPMTCDTTMLQGRGVSFSLAEAELVWPTILEDAVAGELRPAYGRDQRWTARLDPPVLVPPSRRDQRRYAISMLGIYPARGCPYSCNFCSVIKIAGHQIRSQPIETTIASMRAAKAAGVQAVMFTSDNFNKYPEVRPLLRAIIDERLRLPFFAQCDTQIHKDPELVELLGRAGCFQFFVGAESFSAEALKGVHKFHNDPRKYERIVELCHTNGITAHFSNIIGFPSDTERSILEHLRVVRELGPDVASFYVLTPIPGTEQYDEFMREGWITERNLDRYDGSCMNWRHPTMSAEALQRLLMRCYREFFSARDIARNCVRAVRGPRDFRLPGSLISIAGLGVMARVAVAGRHHPMAGGFGRVRRDHAREYAALRRQAFDIDLAPLPASLTLSAADQQANRRAKLVVHQ
jgi:hypothetical protein